MTLSARPLRTAFVLDLRTCDTDPAHCTSDGEPDLAWVNDGTGRTWMSELLDRT